MKTGLFIVLILTDFFILFFLYLAHRKIKTIGSLAKVVCSLLGVALVVTLCVKIIMLNPSYKPALFVQGVYFACFDWMLICLMHFLELFTNSFKGNKYFIIGVYTFAVGESVSFLINSFTNHIFDLEFVENSYVIYWKQVNSSVFFDIHLIFSYVMVAMGLIALMGKTGKVKGFYRTKYIVILVSFIVVILVNALYIFTDIPYDISVLIYVIFGGEIAYYSLYFYPRSLIQNTLSMVVNDIEDAIVCYDAEGKCVYYNEPLKHYYEGDLLNNMLDKLSEYAEEGKDEINNQMEWTEEKNINGQVRNHKFYFSKLVEKNEYVGCFFVISDRTKEVENYKKEHYNITHDKQTNVLTRISFLEAVGKKLRESNDEQFYMVVSNIKDFKLYNELFGVEKGDELLKMEAELLKKGGLSDTLIGRISGDEFAILVHKQFFDEKLFIDGINEMKNRFNSPLYNLYIYVGVYEINNDFDERIEEPSILCDKARMAINSIKGDYNQIIAFYDDKLLNKAMKERKIINEFENALKENQFCIYLQPQVSTEGKIYGAEALVRWQHPEDGLIFPGDFIEVLEKTGLIYKLDVYVWKQAVKKLREWKDRNIEYYISVNVSVKDFYYINIYNTLVGLVEEYGIDPKKLRIEITETVLMSQFVEHKTMLDELRKYGFILEMDDFGSGYSSLNMLKNIDVDVIKIDMCFMRDNEREEKNNRILKSIINLINNLNIEVITEGVETKEQVDNVDGMGCSMFQGYYFDKPMPVESFEEKYIS